MSLSPLCIILCLQDQIQEQQTIEIKNNILDRSILHLKTSTILSTIYPHSLYHQSLITTTPLLFLFSKKLLCSGHAFSESEVIFLSNHTDIFNNIEILKIQDKKIAIFLKIIQLYQLIP